MIPHSRGKWRADLKFLHEAETVIVIYVDFYKVQRAVRLGFSLLVGSQPF